MSDTKLYPVLSNVRHNGTLYSPDDADHSHIELTPEEAKPLLSLKVIGEPEAATEPSQSPALSSDERKQAILNAFPSLKADEDLTKAGEPKVKSVEALVGFDVSADEVKAVWAEQMAIKDAIKGDVASDTDASGTDISSTPTPAE